MTMLDSPRTIPVADMPDLATHIRSLGFLTPEAAARLDAIENATFVLIRMDQGEHWRCDLCGAKRHTQWGTEYATAFTKLCVPRPFRGASQALYTRLMNLGGARPGDLSPSQRRQVQGIGLPAGDLAAAHPRAAQSLGTPSGSVDYVDWLLGSAIPISEDEARRFASLINGRAYKRIIEL